MVFNEGRAQSRPPQESATTERGPPVIWEGHALACLWRSLLHSVTAAKKACAVPVWGRAVGSTAWTAIRRPSRECLLPAFHYSLKE